TATIEIVPGEGVDIEISFAAERTLDLFIAVYDECRHFYALDRQGVVDEPFGVTGLDLVADKVLPGDGDQCRIVLIEDLHPALQYETHKTKPVLQEVVEEILKDLRMVQPRILEHRHHPVYVGRGAGKTERTRIGHHAGIQAGRDIDVDQRGMSRLHDEVID